jgi:hypothetical protein
MTGNIGLAGELVIFQLETDFWWGWYLGVVEIIMMIIIFINQTFGELGWR